MPVNSQHHPRLRCL